LQEQAERALREGRPAEALGCYRRLLKQCPRSRWCLREVACWDAGRLPRAGQTTQGGISLLALRRFDEAQRCFDPTSSPFEWLFAPSFLGVFKTRPRSFTPPGCPHRRPWPWRGRGTRRERWSSGGPAWDTSGCAAHPYETALVHFNLARVLRQLGDNKQARAEAPPLSACWEGCADDFETRGERERALGLLRGPAPSGKDAGSFRKRGRGHSQFDPPPGWRRAAPAGPAVLRRFSRIRVSSRRIGMRPPSWPVKRRTSA